MRKSFLKGFFMVDAESIMVISRYGDPLNMMIINCPLCGGVHYHGCLPGQRSPHCSYVQQKCEHTSYRLVWDGKSCIRESEAKKLHKIGTRISELMNRRQELLHAHQRIGCHADCYKKTHGLCIQEEICENFKPVYDKT